MYNREAGLQETEDWLFLLPENYKRLIENWARQHYVIEKVITSCYSSIGMLYTVERCENDRDKKEYYADAAL